MISLVVDASVAVKWFFSEIHSTAARRVLATKNELIAPDIFWPEVGNTIWKKVRRREVTGEEAGAILKDFTRFPVYTYGSQVLLAPAWEMANRFGVSVYDGLYLALAVHRNSSLITADRKFYDALHNQFSENKVLWVENAE